jgi:hypothetical protein
MGSHDTSTFARDPFAGDCIIDALAQHITLSVHRHG